MATDLTLRAEALLSQVGIEPQLIVEIDGLPVIGALDVKKIPRYGEDGLVFGEDDLFYGGVITDKSAQSLINLSKSTNSITQQLNPDKGGSSSATNMNIFLIDKDGIATSWITPGSVITDILSAKARVYLNFSQGAHPEDSLLLMTGIVDNIDAGTGYVYLTIGNSEKLKKSKIFPKVSATSSGAIDASQTTINVDTTNGFLSPADGTTLRTYVRIDDEIVQYTGVTSTSFTGCTRGALGTIAVSHDDASNLESFYRVTGEMKDLALKILLSNGGGAFRENLSIASFVSYGVDSIANTIHFTDSDFQKRYGLVLGDKVTVTGATNGANNVTNAVISEFGTYSGGSYIKLTGVSLTPESPTTGVVKLYSKYNVLPQLAGANMSPMEVDVARHEEIDLTYGSLFFPYDYYIKDETTVSEFVNEKIYYPSGCNSIPVTGKSSLSVSFPPVVNGRSVILNEDNCSLISQSKVNRTVNKNFANAIVYKYDENILDERFLRGKITLSADSTNRIKYPNTPISIEANGIRPSGDTVNKIQSVSNRLLDRYQFGAESIEIKTNYKTGFNIDIGDIIVFDGRNLNLPDSTNGSREFQPRIMEVTNKSMSIQNGEVKLMLTDTAYGLDARFTSFAPASILGAGSTTTKLVLTNSYGTTLTVKNENWKWEPYVGELIKVRNEDWTFVEEVTLESLDAGDDFALNISALSSPPASGYIVEAPDYGNDTDASIKALWKSMHGYWNNQGDVVTGISSTQFTVSATDAERIAIDGVVRVHNADFSIDSLDVKVSNIVGVTITVEDMGFTPSAGFKIELGSFADKGKPFRWI